MMLKAEPVNGRITVVQDTCYVNSIFGVHSPSSFFLHFFVPFLYPFSFLNISAFFLYKSVLNIESVRITTLKSTLTSPTSKILLPIAL
jgi:hypothetical protein